MDDSNNRSNITQSNINIGLSLNAIDNNCQESTSEEECESLFEGYIQQVLQSSCHMSSDCTSASTRSIPPAPAEELQSIQSADEYLSSSPSSPSSSPRGGFGSPKNKHKTRNSSSSSNTSRNYSLDRALIESSIEVTLQAINQEIKFLLSKSKDTSQQSTNQVRSKMSQAYESSQSKGVDFCQTSSNLTLQEQDNFLVNCQLFRINSLPGGDPAKRNQLLISKYKTCLLLLSSVLKRLSSSVNLSFSSVIDLQDFFIAGTTAAENVHGNHSKADAPAFDRQDSRFSRLQMDKESVRMFYTILCFMWLCLVKGPTRNGSAFFDHIKMYVYGISIPVSCKEFYGSHCAAFYGKLPELRYNLSTNDRFHAFKFDYLGLSTLQLAILMDSRKSVIVCCECKCDAAESAIPNLIPSAKSLGIIKRSESMLKSILFMEAEQNRLVQEAQLQRIKLTSIPDCTFLVSWSQESSFILPFLKRMTPGESYRIYKKGESIRIDFGSSEEGKKKNRKNSNGSSSNEGSDERVTSSSFYSTKPQLTGNPQKESAFLPKCAYSILYKEHTIAKLIDQRACNIIPLVRNVPVNVIEDEIDDLLIGSSERRHSSSWEMRNLTLTQQKSIWSDAASTERVNDITAIKYTVDAILSQKGLVNSNGEFSENLDTLPEYLNDFPFQKYSHCFEDYFEITSAAPAFNSLIPTSTSIGGSPKKVSSYSALGFFDYSSNATISILEQFIEAAKEVNRMSLEGSQSSKRLVALQESATENSENMKEISGEQVVNATLWLRENEVNSDESGRGVQSNQGSQRELTSKDLSDILLLISASNPNFSSLQTVLHGIALEQPSAFPVKIDVSLAMGFRGCIEFKEFNYATPSAHLFALEAQIQKRREEKAQTGQTNKLFIQKQQQEFQSESSKFINVLHAELEQQILNEKQKMTLKKLYSNLKKYTENSNLGSSIMVADYQDELERISEADLFSRKGNELESSFVEAFEKFQNLIQASHPDLHDLFGDSQDECSILCDRNPS